MVQDSTGRCEAVSDILVSERVYEHFVDGGKKNFSKSLVGAVVLVEECGRGVESIANLVIWAPVELAGMYGEEPGLTGTAKAVRDKVLYTAGDTVSWRRSRVLQPRLDWTEVAFELSFKLTSAMVLYVGVPTMVGIVGNGKPSMILSMTVGMVID